MERVVVVRKELRIPVRTAVVRLSTAVLTYCQAPRTHLAVVVEMQQPGKVKPEKHLRQPARFVAENCFVVVRLVFHLE